MAQIEIDITRLPSTNREVFGRDDELAWLDRCWNDGVRVVSIVAMGGVGKSTLVNEWLRRMDEAGWCGTERVYGWSFYRQGTGEGGSSDDFFADAFQWFGDPNPPPTSPWDRGRRLAKLIQEKRTLLVLDGVEPLQEKPLGSEAKIQDLALASLILSLAQKNIGLCVLTTRMPISDLNRFSQQMVQSVNLEHLSPKAGAKLLRQQGAKGRDDELEVTSNEYKGHALALMLLGSYLAEIANGDIQRRNEIGALVYEEQYGGHARRVMDAYEPWLGPRERTILRLLGLFDRPAKAGELDALRADPPVPGLNETVAGISEREWASALTRLRRVGLVSAESGEFVDVHPLVRQHFGEKLRRENEDTWREGHRRLYEYLKNIAKPLPETIQEMAPLYAAVVHGCLAGMHNRAFLVWWTRIHRKGQAYSTSKFGTFAFEARIFAEFFTSPWEKISSNVKRGHVGFILFYAGYNLGAAGRVLESAVLLRKAREQFKSDKNQKQVLKCALALAHFLAASGDLNLAAREAQQCIRDADSLALAERVRNENLNRAMELIQPVGVRIELPPEEIRGDFLPGGSRTVLAEIFHAMGKRQDAALLFTKAEALAKKDNEGTQYLWGIQGFRYCSFLLESGKSFDAQNVERRAEAGLKVTEADDNSRDCGLYCLARGLVRIRRLMAGYRDAGSDAIAALDRAVELLRRGGVHQDVPLGLLARAALHVHTHAFADAHADLDEAMDIATRCGFRLHEADAHLGYARLGIAEDNLTAAREHLAKARVIIDETGYHRRDGEVRDLQGALSKLS